MDLTWFLMIKYLISFDETTKFGFGITFKKERVNMIENYG